MDQDRISRLVAEGHSLRQIAAAVDVSYGEVRLTVLRLGIETSRMRSQRLNLEARSTAARSVVKHCPSHGETEHRLDAQGGFRCPRCNVDRVAARRRAIKQRLIDEAGGLCAICGYDRCARALHFHHIDRDEKEFGLATRGVSRSIAKARAEADKCVLLCSNCHMEVEAGLAAVPEI